MVSVSAIVGPHALFENEVYTVLTGTMKEFINCRKLVLYTQPTWVYHPPFSDSFYWVPSKCLFLMFVLHYHAFWGRLFERLDYTRDTFPLIHDGGWMLHPDLVQEWRTLEVNLRVMLFNLLEYEHGSFLPKNFQLWAFPN